MADKNEFQEKTDIRDSVFLPPGKNEFRNQMNQSLALYSEGLDKLIMILLLILSISFFRVHSFLWSFLQTLSFERLTARPS